MAKIEWYDFGLEKTQKLKKWLKNSIRHPCLKRFDSGYRLRYFSTSGRNLETGSWLFAMKPTMFWYHFSQESIKTHSETILSLYETDGKGNADKNLFVLLDTVI